MTYDKIRNFYNMIICQNSKNLNFIPANSITLTVTSPPYHNAINYFKHLQRDWYRGNQITKLEDYLDEMEQIFSEVFRVTKQGGYCAIVIGNELAEGEMIPLPHLLTQRLLKEWKFPEEIIWSKVTGGLDRFGVTIQHPYPSYYRSNIMHEHILILRKSQVHHRKDKKSKLTID